MSPRDVSGRTVMAFVVGVLAGLGASDVPGAPPEGAKGTVLNAGFVCVEKVYNSELMAPYDVLQHT